MPTSPTQPTRAVPEPPPAAPEAPPVAAAAAQAWVPEVERAAEGASEGEPVSARPREQRGVRDQPVLVVDDESDLVMTYERLLRRQGYRTISAGSRQAGLAALQAQPVRLVIADLLLPDGDGLDVVRAARALPSPPPVLVATVLASRESRRNALAAGAAAFLAKPFATAAFNRVVGDLLTGAPH